MKNKIFRIVAVFFSVILLVCPLINVGVSALTFPGTVTFDNRFNVPFESVTFQSEFAIDAITMTSFEFGVNDVYNRNTNSYVMIHTDVNNEFGLGTDLRVLTTILAPDHANTTYYRASNVLFYGLDDLEDGLYQLDLLIVVDIVSDGNNVQFDTGAYSTTGILIDGMGVSHSSLIVYDEAEGVTFSLDENVYNNIFNRFDQQINYDTLSSSQHIISLRKPFYDDFIGGGNDDGSYDEGYDIGYSDGYNLGSKDGFTMGYNKGASDELVKGFFGNMLGGVVSAIDSIRFYEETVSDNGTPEDPSDDVVFYISLWSIFCSIIIFITVIALLKVWRGG